MATCTQLYKTGMRMMEEKIELELAEPDDFSSLNIYNQWRSTFFLFCANYLFNAV